jgi:hypothetical protein
LYAVSWPRLLGYRSGHGLRRFGLDQQHVLTTVPRRFTAGFILPRAERPLQSTFSQLSARRLELRNLPATEATNEPYTRYDKRLLGGSAFPHRDVSAWCPPVAKSTQLLATFRPRRSSRPRRFAPPRALRACFIPQPRPGFSLQGFGHTAEPYRVFPGLYPLAVSSIAPAFPKMAPARRPRLQGFAPHGECSALQPAVRPDEDATPLLGFFSSRHQVLRIGGTPSRSLHPRPCLRRALRRRTHGVSTARRPTDLEPDRSTCTRFLA